VITVDGTEGGGQLLRTALSLAAVFDVPFRIEDIRGARPTPGLKAQHLAAVTVVADYCDAEVAGAELGSAELTFRPGDDRRASLQADIGTAGSVTLLFDTVLPVGAAADRIVELAATGGTNVKWSPTVEYYRRVKLPLLVGFGVRADVDLDRTGFYPAGGGAATVRTRPSTLSPVDLETRGTLDRVDIYSKASEDLADREVSERQADHAEAELAEAGFEAERRRAEYVPARSTGSSLLLRGVYEGTLVGVDALGERGRTAEDVAEGAVREFVAFHDTGAAVDRYMADQVIPFLALAGGRVRVPARTAHVRTNLDLVARFGSDCYLDRGADGALTLVASPTE
jgi:RNA 3'-terminal phosphate cyclase (ATP)